MTNVISVVSGKGGVGKTVTSLNIAVALTRLGSNVVVVDTNLSSPDLCVHLGSPKVPIDLHDVLDGKKDIRDSIYRHPSGVRVVPGDISFQSYQEHHLEKLHDAINNLRGNLDMVFLDAPPGLGKDAVEVIKASDYAIVVTTPDMPSVIGALRTIKVAHRHKTKVMGVIINRVRNAGFEMSIKNIETLLEYKILGTIPEDNSILESIQLRHPVVHSHPDSNSSIAFKRIAATLLGQSY